MNRWTGLAVAALLLMGVLAVVALAATPTDLTLSNPSYGTYKGKATSDKRACKRNRMVIVRHDQDRDDYDNQDYRIGADKTDRRGRFEVHGNQAPGGDQIAAKVTRKELRDGTVCKGDTVTARATSPMPPGY